MVDDVQAGKLSFLYRFKNEVPDHCPQPTATSQNNHIVKTFTLSSPSSKESISIFQLLYTMPLKKGANGGWQRVSSKTSRQEMSESSASSSSPDESKEPSADMNAASSADTTTKHSKDKKNHAPTKVTCGIDQTKKDSAGMMEISNSTSWAVEGMRRVRSDRVIRRMRFVTAMAALGGFLFGYDTGVISGAMLPIKRAFSLTPSQEEAIVSSTIFAAFLSSLVGGQINNVFGRRRAILLAAATFTIGAFMLMLAWDYWTLVLGRVVIGIGIGIASLTTPIYLAEVAVPSVRGQLVTINAFLVTIGQFTAGMVDGAFDTILPGSGWRYMLGLAAIPSITMFVGFLTLPESPRWLASKGRREEALQVLQHLRESDQEAEDELAEIMGTVTVGVAEKEDIELEDRPQTEYGSVRACEVPSSPVVVAVVDPDYNSARLFEMLLHGPTRRALFVGCGIMLVQQCSGVNTVMVRTTAVRILCMCSLCRKHSSVLSCTVLRCNHLQDVSIQW